MPDFHHFNAEKEQSWKIAPQYADLLESYGGTNYLLSAQQGWNEIKVQDIRQINFLW